MSPTRLIATLGFLAFSTWAAASGLPPIQACFTPQDNCTRLIVEQIRQAKSSIYVQAYSLTSYPIVNALIRAHYHHVDVEVIADHSQFQADAHSLVNDLLKHHIPVWDDTTVTIAHSKVMIFDEKTVETGSFNFTYAAQHHNAENVLIVRDPALAKQYLANWRSRQKVSTKV